MARTIEDVLARRIRLLFLDAEAAIESAEQVSFILAASLKKDEAWRLEQLQSFKAMAEHYILK